MPATKNRLGAQANELSEDHKETGVAKDAAQQKLKEVRENAAEYYERGRDNVHGVLCNFEQSVRERPVKSLLIAAGVGLLFGRFWMRR